MKIVFKLCTSPPINKNVSDYCNHCCVGKSHRLPSSSSKSVYSKPFELVFTDLWGAAHIFLNIAKSFKVGNADQNANQAVHTNRLENLKQLFSSPPFLKSSSSTVDKQDPFVIDIDDIQIDEPVVFSSPQKIDIDKRDKGKGTDRQKLLEEVSTDSKPKARTAEEIKAKYRKTGDASAATALARDKLVERQEKLQLQNGAQDFASMATELAKRMENRKWWQL
ncbi:uncharacterized protein [Glycine max]|uniref:uncharacterized protein isoform X2 n=1 Tax=Glycine max TaxID=3847 RepID=UPI0003DECCC2|nr:uncharacterized protein LOC102662071 isoform X2 [Glycine max]